MFCGWGLWESGEGGSAIQSHVYIFVLKYNTLVADLRRLGLCASPSR